MLKKNYRLFMHILPLEIQLLRGGDGIPWTSLIPLNFCACPKPMCEFPGSNDVVFFVFSELRRRVIVHFIGGILDPHYLNFLFIIWNVCILCIVGQNRKNFTITCDRTAQFRTCQVTGGTRSTNQSNQSETAWGSKYFVNFLFF